MNTKHMVAFLAATALTPVATLAQGTIELDEAIVFSGIIPVDVNRTGTTVEVIDEETIETGPQNLEATLDRIPGVSVTSSGPLGTTSALRIRGLAQYYTGVTFDGIEVTDPSVPQNFYDVGLATRAGIGRIEIAKGVQTTVYGSDAIAGAVNITSWRPTREGLSYGATVEAGSYGTVSGALNFGYLDDDSEVALTISQLETKGFSAREEDDEDDGFEQSKLTLSFSRDLGEAVTVGGSFFFADDEADYDNTDFIGPDPVTPEGGTDSISRGARAYVQIEGESINHEFAVSTFGRDRVEDFGGGFTGAFSGDRDKVEYLGTVDLNDRVTFAFGADWTEETYESDFDDGSAINSGVFGEVQYAVSDQTDVSFAARYDMNSDFDDVLTGRLALVHRAGNGLTYRASLGNGFRAPSLYERFAGFGTGNPDLLPEESVGGEIGVEKAFAQGFVSATLFRTDVDNRIDYDFTTFRYEQVEGTTVTQGVELAGEYVIGNTTVYGAYTYTDAETDGIRANRVPRHDLTLGLEVPVTDKLEIAGEITAVKDVLDFGTPLDDYIVTNVSATYAVNDNLDAYVRIENLFDEDYQTVRTYNMPGLSAFVGVSARF